MSAYGTSRRHAPPRNYETPGLRYYVTVRRRTQRCPRGAPTGLEVVKGSYDSEQDATAAARNDLDVTMNGWIADIEVAYQGGRHLRWICNVAGKKARRS